MTREEAQELLPVLTAYAEGKTIQYRAIDGGYWYDIEDDRDVDWDSYEFRVKEGGGRCQESQIAKNQTKQKIGG